MNRRPLKNAFHAFHGLFRRWFNTVEFWRTLPPIATHSVFAQLVVGEEFDLFSVAHITGKFTEAMRLNRSIVRRSLDNRRSGSTLAFHIFVRQIFGELQRAVVGNSNQILVDLVVRSVRDSALPGRLRIPAVHQSPDRNDEQNRWCPDSVRTPSFLQARQPVTNKLKLAGIASSAGRGNAVRRKRS